MSQLTVICISCGDLFHPDSDTHNQLPVGSLYDHRFYLCDECIKQLLDGELDIPVAG